MRKFLILGPVLSLGALLAACASTANVPPKVSWSYGAGNGDGVQYPGPPPQYSFAYGPGKDVPVSSGQTPTMGYAYGAESTTGDMVQMVKPQTVQTAQPGGTPTSSPHS